MTMRPFRRVQMRLFRRVQLHLCLCDMLQAMTLRQPLPISAFVTLKLSMSMTCGLTGWNQLMLLRFGSADWHGRYCVLSTLDQTPCLASAAVM